MAAYFQDILEVWEFYLHYQVAMIACSVYCKVVIMNTIPQQPAPIKQHLRSILKLAAPMAGSRFIQMLTGFIGMLMLAHLGKNVLAASVLMNSSQITITVFFISILLSLGVVTGRLFGENKLDEIGALVQQGFLFGLILCVPMLIAYLYIGDVLLFFHQSPSLVKYVKEFFYGCAWMVVPMTLLVCLQQFCYGVLKQRVVITVNIICLLVFIPVAYLMIFGGLGMKGFGVKGYGIAVTIQMVLNVVLLVWIIYSAKEFHVYQIFKRHQHRGLKYIKQLLVIGWPMGAQFGGELLSFFVNTIFVGWLGERALAAAQITQQVMLLFIVPMFAVSESAGILVSQLVGEKRFIEVRRIGSLCVGIGLVFVSTLDLTMIFFPHLLSAMYINIHDAANAGTVSLASKLFILVAIMLLFDTVRNLSSGALRGLYDTQYSMWVSLGVMWLICVPVGYLLGFTVGWGVVGIRIGGIVGIILGAHLLWRRWKKKSTELMVRA